MSVLKGWPSRRCAGSRHEGRRFCIWVTGLVISLLFASLVLPGGSGLARSAAAGPSVVASSMDNGQVSNVSTSAVVNVGANNGPIPAGFWGFVAQTAGSHAFTTDPSLGQYVNSTPVTEIRYGEGDDACNVTSNTGWAPGPSGGVVTGGCGYNITSFKAWCYSTTPHCLSIIDLAGENNNSYEDANIANYVVNKVGFQPTYFSIGNEPSGWCDYGLAWTAWVSGAACRQPTALDYAWDVKNAITRVKAVDPSAQFIGIEEAWCPDNNYVPAVAKLDGDSIAAIACHAYPGGKSNPTTAQYFEPLDSAKSNLEYYYASVRQHITGLCSSCATLPIQMGEYNGGPSTGTPAAQDREFDGSVFLAASVVQALDVGYSSFQFFNLQGGSSCIYCLLKSNNAESPAAILYSQVLTSLGSGDVYNATVSSGHSTNLWATLVYDRTTEAGSLLFVNANLTNTVSFSLPSTYFNAGASGTVIAWNSSTTDPITTPYASLPSQFSVPPLSTFLVTANALHRVSGATNLTVTSRTSSTIGLSWKNPTGSLVNDTVWYGASCTALKTPISTGGVASTDTVTGLTPSTNYCFAVQAFTSSGGSPLSSTVSTSTLEAVFPEAPTGLTVLHFTRTTLLLAWTNPGGSVLVNDTVAFGTSCDSLSNHASTGGAATTYTIRGLVAGTNYCAAVQAWNSTGASPFSPPVSQTVGSVPAAPAGLSATAETDSTVSLSWTNPGTGGLVNNTVWVGTSCGSWKWANSTEEATTSFTVPYLALGTPFCFAVQAYNGTGGSLLSATIMQATGGPLVPAAPTGLSATGFTVSSISLSWRNPGGGGLVNDTVWYGTSCGSFETPLSVGVVTNYTVTGLSAGSSYCLAIQAFNSTGGGPLSSSATATTLTPSGGGGHGSGNTSGNTPGNTSGVGSASPGPPSGTVGGPDLVLQWLTLAFLGSSLGAMGVLVIRAVLLTTVFVIALAVLLSRRPRHRRVPSRSPVRVVRVVAGLAPGWKAPPDAGFATFSVLRNVKFDRTSSAHRR